GRVVPEDIQGGAGLRKVADGAIAWLERVHGESGARADGRVAASHGSLHGFRDGQGGSNVAAARDSSRGWNRAVRRIGASQSTGRFAIRFGSQDQNHTAGSVPHYLGGIGPAASAAGRPTPLSFYPQCENGTPVARAG